MLRVEASGNWTIAHLGEADGALRTLVAGAIEAEHANIDLSGITGFDTSSAIGIHLVEQPALSLADTFEFDAKPLLLERPRGPVENRSR